MLARPYESGAPEVEALLRLNDEGLRVEEVAVDMRERASGESKLQGKKALVSSITVIVTCLGAKRSGAAGVARLVAVLGYSARRGEGIHPVCAARLAAAEATAHDADTVLLSGWSRRSGRASEASLMQAAWEARPCRCSATATRDRRSATRAAVAATAKSIGADEVVVVTSSWHRSAREAARTRLRSART